MQRQIIAVTSLAREALIARGAGVSVVCGQSSRLGDALNDAIGPGVSGIISFGISGGLHPELVAGDWVVATSVRHGDRIFTTDSKWARELVTRLPNAILADVAGSDVVVSTPAGKARLYETGVVAVDMESHIAAEIAAKHGIPFASCRVIIDSAHRTLPAATSSALDSKGTVDVLAVMRSVIRMPSQLPDLARAARDAYIAERALRNGRKRLGAGFGSPFVSGREPADRPDVANDLRLALAAEK
ncbi:MAG TPA: phosphorylase [Pseudolabrys sp.]|nr:phosphorylase [Pseudolabrys sp.]